MSRSRWIGWAIAALLLAAMFWHLSRERDLLAELGSLGARDLAGLFVLTLVAIAAEAAAFDRLARIFRLRLSVREWFGLHVINHMFSYLAASVGGMVARAAYLRQRHEFAYTDYVAMLASGQLIAFANAAIIGVAVALAWGLDVRLLGLFAFALASSVAGYFALSLTARLGVSERWPRFTATIARFGAGFARWRERPVAVLAFGAACAVAILASVPRMLLAFHAIGETVTVLDVIAIRALASIFTLVTLTPGNLGIREGIVAFSAPLLGIDAATALLAALIERALGTVAIFTLGPIFSHLLVQQLAEPQESA